MRFSATLGLCMYSLYGLPFFVVSARLNREWPRNAVIMRFYTCCIMQFNAFFGSFRYGITRKCSLCLALRILNRCKARV